MQRLPRGPLARLEYSLVFLPEKYPAGNWEPADLNFEDVWFRSADGTRLHGWYCDQEAPRAHILFLHGNAGNLSHRAEVMRTLHDRFGVAAMIFDYRGYGRSEGKPSEVGILQDARAARKWLASRAGIAESEIVLMGRSLGGGVAVDLAARDGAKGLILESTFTSLPDVGAAHSSIPTRLLMRNRLNSLAKIPDYHGPLLMSHGDSDSIIPYEQARHLFAAANQPKRFITIPQGDHNDPQTPEYYAALDEFIGAIVSRK